MINTQIVYYLGSKLLAAIINLATMALFVRIGGAQVYGGYVVVLAWAYVVYGLTLQWLRFSFFACYREEGGRSLIAVYLVALAGGLLILTLAAIAGTALDLFSGEFAFSLMALVIGLASYDALSEMARTRLMAREVAAGTMARALLMLVLGVGTLFIEPSARALATAVGLAHIGACVPLALSMRNQLSARPSREGLTSMWHYGRPLIPAFGLDSIGLQIDRLLLSRFDSLHAVGVYGAVADFVRQTMIVVSEAIAGAYISVARAAAVDGKTDTARRVLGEAFLAYTALTVFAAAFILRFDRLLFDTLFGAEIGAAVEPAIAFIVASNAAGIFRAYYFGQVLYLTPSSHLLLYSNGAHVVVAAIAGVLLVPSYGIAGAAIAMAAGHLAGCAVYVVSWRDHFILQLPYAKAVAIAGLAALAYIASGQVEAVVRGAVKATAINLAIYAACALIAARLFDILSFNALWARIAAALRARLGSTPAS